MSRKDEFTAGTGKAVVPPSDKDIFAEEPTMPSVPRSTVPQDSPEVGAYDAGRPIATGQGTPIKLDENGNGTSVAGGRVVSGPKPTQASKAADNARPRIAPIMGAGGTITGIQHIERSEIDPEEIKIAEAAAAKGRPREAGGTTDLRLGELAKADPTIHEAFKAHIKSWRRRGAKGMDAPHGLTGAAVKVGRKLADQGEEGVLDHPAFRNDVTYQRVADAISGDVGMVQDHKNLDKNGQPTVRKLNSEDLADFAKYHRHIFGHSQHVSETMADGTPGHYRVDPAAFSMFNLVGKHQRRGKDNAQSVPQINVDGTKQDAYHWMVGAIRKHVDTNATKNRRELIMDKRTERREEGIAREKMDNVDAGVPADLSDIKEAYSAGHIKAGEAADLIKTSIHSRGSYAPRSTESIMPETRYGAGPRTAPMVKRGEKTFTPVEQEKPVLHGVQPGDKISHDTYGMGTVVAHKGTHVEVNFGDLDPVDRTTPRHRLLPVHTKVDKL